MKEMLKKKRSKEISDEEKRVSRKNKWITKKKIRLGINFNPNWLKKLGRSGDKGEKQKENKG